MTRDTKIALALGLIAIAIGVGWWFSSQTTLIGEGERIATIDVIPATGEAQKFTEVRYTDGQTALDVTNSVIVVETTTSNSETVVTSIGGVVAAVPARWALRVNGQPTDTDPATYYVQPNDLLSWRLISQ